MPRPGRKSPYPALRDNSGNEDIKHRFCAPSGGSDYEDGPDAPNGICPGRGVIRSGRLARLRAECIGRIFVRMVDYAPAICIDRRGRISSSSGFYWPLRADGFWRILSHGAYSIGFPTTRVTIRFRPPKIQSPVMLGNTWPRGRVGRPLLYRAPLAGG